MNMISQTEDDNMLINLINKIKQYDDDAYIEFEKQLAKNINYILNKYYVKYMDDDDLRQSIRLELIKAIRSFDASRSRVISLRYYFHKKISYIVISLIRELYRENRAVHLNIASHILDSDDPENNDLFDLMDDGSFDLLCDNIIRDDLHRVLSDLEGDYKADLIIMHYVDGMQYDDLVAQFGRSPKLLSNLVYNFKAKYNKPENKQILLDALKKVF